LIRLNVPIFLDGHFRNGSFATDPAGPAWQLMSALI
jgi:hypothetical protein